MARPSQHQSDLRALMRVTKTARPINTEAPDGDADVASSRQAIADFCRYLGARLSGATFDAPVSPIPKNLKLSPRMRQTLDRLLAGDSEKQIALALAISQHTVHIYVKTLYRAFDVSSRGELLAKFVRLPSAQIVQKVASPAVRVGEKDHKIEHPRTGLAAWSMPH